MTLSKSLRQAVSGAKVTRYRIAKDSGVDHAVIRRFVSGERDITLQTAEKLAEYFKLKLTKKD